MPAPRVALLGTFDVDNYGDHLFPRVAAQELTRRLPGASVDAWSPYGWLHPTPLDEGRPASPLGPWSPARAAALAGAYDAVVLGGGELIHLNDPLLAAVYGTTPAELDWLAPSRFFLGEGAGGVMWNAVGVPLDPDPNQSGRLRDALAGAAYVAVRDARSEERLRRAGVAGEIAVVPDSAFLLDRILSYEALDGQLDRLRVEGCYPPGAPVVVQGCDLLIPHAEAIASALVRSLSSRGAAPDVVLVETGRCRGDAPFADAIARRLPGHRVWRLPPDSSVAQIAAAVAGAAAFVGSSLHGAITALVYGRPFVVVNPAGEPKLDGFADLVGLPDRLVHQASGIPAALDRALGSALPPGGLVQSLQARVDAHFDRIAVITDAAAARRRSQRDRPDRATLERAAVVELVAWLDANTGTGDARQRADLAEARLAARVTSRRSLRPARSRDLYRRLRRRP